MANTTLERIEAEFMRLARRGEAGNMRVLLGYQEFMSLIADGNCRQRLHSQADTGWSLDGVPLLELRRPSYLEVVRA